MLPIYMAILFLFPAVTSASLMPSYELEAKIKRCMGSIYTAEALYKNSHKNYTAFADELGLYENRNCERLRISITKKAGFTALVARGRLAWTIDSNRTQKKLR